MQAIPDGFRWPVPERPESADDENEEHDHLAHCFPLPAVASLSNEIQGVEGGYHRGECGFRPAGKEPGRNVTGQGTPKVSDHEQCIGGESQGIQHAGKDGREPDHPPHGESGFHGQDFFCKGVGAARLGKRTGHFCKAEYGYKCNETVQGKGKNGRRPGGSIGNPGKCQDAAPNDGPHTDARGPQQAHGSYRPGIGIHPCPHVVVPRVKGRNHAREENSFFRAGFLNQPITLGMTENTKRIQG